MLIFKMIVHEDITGGMESLIISAENTLDEEKLDYFEYSAANVPSPSCPMEDFELQYAGCDCGISDTCTDSNCLCIRTKSCGVNFDSDGRLQFTILDADTAVGKPVFECNSQCRCTLQCCGNRVVQQGVRCALRIAKTATKGWCLRNVEALPKGAFVCEYAGEVLSYAEAKSRSLAQGASDNNYVITVKEHLASGEVIRTHVDPTHVGNVGRFANHSCDPNLTMIPVRVDNAVPRLALFANRDILSGKELCFDYSGNRGLPSAAPSSHKLCLCGATSCLQFLPFDETLFVT